MGVFNLLAKRYHKQNLEKYYEINKKRRSNITKGYKMWGTEVSFLFL